MILPISPFIKYGLYPVLSKKQHHQTAQFHFNNEINIITFYCCFGKGVANTGKGCAL